jgi:hypothetical protein
MSYPSAELVDLISTLESALIASLRLDRSAHELGAVAVAVLLTEGPQIEVKYFRNRYVDAHDHSVLDRQQDLARAVESPSGPVDAGSPLALVLRDWISADANSFLVFHWGIRQRFVTTVFAFSEHVVPHRRVPDVIAERLNLLALATWSVREMSRLRADLKAVNSRLARRTLVERAKGILQTQQGLSEEQAYAYLRGSSRRRRIPLAELAEEVLRVRARDSLRLYLGQR